MLNKRAANHPVRSYRPLFTSSSGKRQQSKRKVISPRTEMDTTNLLLFSTVRQISVVNRFVILFRLFGIEIFMTARDHCSHATQKNQRGYKWTGANSDQY